MGNEVYANGREVSCKAGRGKSICAFPDVCFTPPLLRPRRPACRSPIPIRAWPATPATAARPFRSAARKSCSRIRRPSRRAPATRRDHAARERRRHEQITGQGLLHGWSMDVKFEGENAVRHLDLTTHNHNSPPGNSPPWPFAKKQAINNPNHPCQKSGDAEAVKNSL